MSVEAVKMAVVGLGGYGKIHLQCVSCLEEMGLGVLHAVVCIDPENHIETLTDYKKRGIRVFNSLEALLKTGGVDVISLPVGIHDHVRLSMACMEAGFHVLVEKPLAGSVQDGNELIDVKNRTGKTVVVGYQNLYSQSIRGIRDRVLDGHLGRILNVTVEASWPRGDHYYSRNPWVGTQKREGIWTLDSPINNAMAHFLMNIFYICSSPTGAPNGLLSVQAELYRAWNIENLDTASLRFITEGGTTAVIAMSHVSETNFGPVMDLVCEKGNVRWTQESCEISYINGSCETITGDDKAMRMGPWLNMINNLRHNEPIISSLEMALEQTICINGAHESCPEVFNIPTDLIREEMIEERGEHHKYLVVDGLNQLIHRSAHEGKLFSELNVPWAKPGKVFSMKDYKYFPSENKDRGGNKRV